MPEGAPAWIATGCSARENSPRSAPSQPPDGISPVFTPQKPVQAVDKSSFLAGTVSKMIPAQQSGLFGTRHQFSWVLADVLG